MKGAMLSRVITARSSSSHIGTAIVVLLTVGACGATEEDEDDSGITEPAQCEGATDRFWPDTADCDPACYTLVEGLIYDEERACYGQSPELTTPLACLRNGLAGASLSCHEVPELGQVMTSYYHPVIYEVFADCWMDRREGFPCTD
jgi:hypothetical protein